MKPKPENVTGKLVESHQFYHSVQHQVNWSHMLFAFVFVIAVWKLTPAMSSAISTSRQGKRH